VRQQLNSVILEGTIIEEITCIEDPAGRRRSVLLLRHSEGRREQCDEFFTVLCELSDARRAPASGAEVLIIGSLSQISLAGRSEVVIEAEHIEKRSQQSARYSSRPLPVRGANTHESASVAKQRKVSPWTT